ncbi:MAG: hypothetical protein H7122_05320 [Chitinophagaceae bacterium]|nr:hypothetical protein [Chitinophagaceae bacterium]
MDIGKALLEEHSRAQCKKIVDYIGADKRKFGALMKAFFEGEYRVTQRAAWPMSYSVRKHPDLIVPYFKKLLEMLQKPGVHNAVARNIARLLQNVKIPKRYHGKIMTICFEYISSETIPAAVKAFSLTILDNLSNAYPEIRPELKLIIEERWQHETPAFKSRAKKILQRT